MTLNKLYERLPFIFITVSFGPYLGMGSGLRLEHIIIYPIFMMFLLLFLVRGQKLIKPSAVIMTLWLVSITLMFARTFFGSAAIGKALADFESVFQPVAIMFLLSVVFKRIDGAKMQLKIEVAGKLLIALLSLNTIWSIASMFVDLNYINMYFWGSAETVATRAMTNGRYSGIFNQPMEAGVLYSLGLLCWLYLSERTNIFKPKYTVSLFLMIIGGLLTVSKIFIFGGLLLFFFGILSNKKILKLVVSLSFWSIAVGWPVVHFFSSRWRGFNYLLRFFNSEQNAVSLLTADRFGTDSQQLQLFTSVWDKNPLFGLGFGSNDVYDSALFYFFGNGGLIGLVFYISIIGYLVYLAVKYLLSFKKNPESKLFGLMILLIIGAGAGAPVLTLNRVSTVMWVLIYLILQYFHFAKNGSVAEPVETINEPKKKRKRIIKKVRFPKIVW